MTATNTRRMTAEQETRCAELREQGWTIAAIAAQVGFTPSAVQWVCLRDGAEPPVTHPLRPVPTEPSGYRRGKVRVRRFTQAEDALVLRLRAEGQTTHAIARATGRRNHTILARFAILARRQEREESAGE